MIRRSCPLLLCLFALVLLSILLPLSAHAQDGAIDSGKNVPHPSPPDVTFVHASDGQFWVDGHTFRHVGVNEMEFIYEGPDAWNDTWFLRQAGVKQIRIILANDNLSNAAIKSRLRDALGAAWDRGIRVTVALTNFYWADHNGQDANDGHTAVPGDTLEDDYTAVCCGDVHTLNHAWIDGGYRDHYLDFVRDIVTEFQDDGRIFAWEIGNEIKDPTGDAAAILSFYRYMATFIKGIDHNHMVAPGIICTAWLPLLDLKQKTQLYEYMDYVTEHHYIPRNNSGSLDDDWLALYLGKPLVIEEFGVSQTDEPYQSDHDRIMPKAIDFFDQAYAKASIKQADAVMVWGVDFGTDLGSGDAMFGPVDQGLMNEYLQLWRESADWLRLWPRYSDVPPGSTFDPYIECLSNRRAVSGLFNWVDDENNDKFRPAQPITRAEAIKAIVRAMDFPLEFPDVPRFTDVPRSSIYYRYIETAVAQQLPIINGYDDGTFRPDAQLTRGQMSKVIVIAGMNKYGWTLDTTGGPHFVDVPVGHTFYPYIETAYNLGIISPNTYFYPGNDTTRGQFAKMLGEAVGCHHPPAND